MSELIDEKLRLALFTSPETNGPWSDLRRGEVSELIDEKLRLALFTSPETNGPWPDLWRGEVTELRRDEKTDLRRGERRTGRQIFQAAPRRP
ncbi:hypothetical protein KUW00_19875 [Halomonas sp. DP5N14-9]|uniref:hypothetical protein n=1 Tax=Halomonas sp. DP5N14-9 TaxID=2859075 RepID=UPI001C9960E7|nr:hypothetical protein [Halomonas sp. DP5N14-9]MBY5943138.1 hypothetical protein [Halomonas sp. DP5N14-9]